MSAEFIFIFVNFDAGEMTKMGVVNKLDKNILMKMIALAPIEVKILLWRGSPQKIVTDSGISF